MNKKILLVFFLALGIRLISLNQSLWLDEATTAKVVQHYNLLEIVAQFSPTDFHPPLYYLFMKVWTSIFGYSEIVLRMPSVLFSLLTGYLVYLIGRSIKNKTIGMWASIFFLFNPLIIYYSQEARMYMMASLLLMTALYYLLTSLRVEKLKPKLLLSLFLSLSFLTFYGSIFLITPMFLYLLYKKHYKLLLISFISFLLSLLCLSPLLLKQLVNAREQLELLANWRNVLGPLNIKNLLLIPLKFSVGRISFYPKWLYWGISGLWTLLIWFFVFLGGVKNKFLFFLVIGSLLLGILFSIFTPLLQYFRFIFLLPIICVLLAHGAKTSISRFVLLGGLLFFSFMYLLNGNFHREDWKNLAISLAQDKQIFMVKSSSDPLIYYRKDLTILDLKLLNSSSLPSEIIVIPYIADIHGINYREVLEKRKFHLDNKSSFRELQLEYWQTTP